MKNNKCKNFSDFVDLVCDQYIFFKNTSEDFIGVSVIAHYEVMIDFINELVKNTDFSLINISIEDPEMDGYDREWVLTIDPDGYIWCEKVYRSGHGGYLFCDEDIVFVHEDVDNGFIKKNAVFCVDSVFLRKFFLHTKLWQFLDFCFCFFI